jgi:hypothetical protein
MAHLNADAMTAGPAPAIHAGVNAQICKFSMGATSSGSLTVSLTPLPAGAEVIGVRSVQSNTIGTGGELISVYATIGGTKVQNYITSSASGIVVEQNGQEIGQRLTASANAVFSLTNAVGTGTASCDFTVIIEYLAQKRGD